jgi:hypothetical protein
MFNLINACLLRLVFEALSRNLSGFACQNKFRDKRKVALRNRCLNQFEVLRDLKAHLF